MYLQKIKCLAILCLLTVAKSVSGQEKALPLDPSVRTGKLPNGFTYYIRHNESPRHRVVFYLANKVGSILETDDQQGLAHFMEHMNFNGTRNFPKNQLVDYLQKAGVRFGADLNAYTGFDETVYQLPIPTDKPELLASGISIMRDWAHGALLEPAEINKERGVILEEKRLRKSAAERMQQQYFPMLLNGSKFASRLPIGTEKILKNFKPETIRSFYQEWYRPDLQALIVVGDIDVDAIEKAIKAKFSDLKNPPREKPRTRYGINRTGKNQYMAVTDREYPLAQIQVIVKHPEEKLITLTDYRNYTVRNIYNQMMSERFQEILTRPDAPFLSGSVNIQHFLGPMDAAAVATTAKTGEYEKGFKASWREMLRVKQFGFIPQEMERAKKSILNKLENSLREKDRTNSENYAREYTEFFLNGTAAPGIKQENDLAKAVMAKISLKELNGVTAKYFKATDRDILITAPEKDRGILPDQTTVEKWMSEVALEKLEPYKEADLGKSLLAKEPSPGKIIKSEKNAALDYTALTLSNGLKVILKNTTFKNDEMLFMAFANGGSSLYDNADYESASNAASLVAQAGVGNLNMTELGKYLNGKNVSVRPYIGMITQGISGGSGNEDLPIAMELIHAYFTTPRRDETVYKNMLERSKVFLANRGNDPGAVFQDTSLSVIYKNNPRLSGPSTRKLDQIDLDRSFMIYKERFADAANFTFLFVGSIDTLKIKPLLEKYLASLPATNHHEMFKELDNSPASGKIEKIVYKGAAERATVRLMFSGSFDYSRESNLQMTALREVLNIRILERLREEESGIYSPQVTNSSSRFPQALYQFNISFGCAPGNVDKLVASALEEIDKIKKNGPSQVNIDKWKAEYSRSMETSLQTNNYWLSAISLQLQNGLEPVPIDSYKARLDSVTTTSIKEAAQRYLSGKNYIKLILMPDKASR